MDDSSYNHREESLTKTVANSNQAYFGELKSIDNDMVCEVCLKLINSGRNHLLQYRAVTVHIGLFV